MSTEPVRPTPKPAAAPHAHAAPQIHSVTYCGHSKLIFLWPVIFLGFLFWPLSGWASVSKSVLGWIYLFTLVTVMLAVTVDLSRNIGIFWIVLVAFILTLGRWLADVKNLPILPDIAHWFARRGVTYDPGSGLCLSVILLFFFVISLVWSWGNNRFTMTHNEVLHRVWGRGDTAVGRGARVITFLYPDWLEAILCLAGTIVVYDNTGRTQICRSENVPFLPFRKSKIEKILESLEVTQDDSTTASDDHADGGATDDLH